MYNATTSGVPVNTTTSNTHRLTVDEAVGETHDVDSGREAGETAADAKHHATKQTAGAAADPRHDRRVHEPCQSITARTCS